MAKPSLMGVPNASARNLDSGCNLVVEAVRKCGRVRLRVSGASMVPSMRPGDLITVESASASEISIGEIVVFARDGRLVVHRVTSRIVNAREPLLITRGDRMKRYDPAVGSAELLGRVTQIERGNRSVRLRTSLSAAEQMFCRLLRISDHATSLYLRVSQ